MDLHPSTVTAGESLHGGQTKTASEELGREERVENPLLGFFIHAAAGILHFDGHLFAGCQSARTKIAPGGFFAEFHHRRAHEDGTGRLFPDGFHEIPQQIGDGLPQQFGIGLDGRQARPAQEFQADGPGNLDGLDGIPHYRINLRTRHAYFAFAGVGEHPARDFSGPFAGLHDTS